MNLALLGALVGLLGGVGILLVVTSLVPVRPTLADRVLPYVPEVAWALRHDSAGAVRGAGPRARREIRGTPGRLRRSRSGLSVGDFRVEQVLWGAVASTAAVVVWFLAGGDVLDRPGELAVVATTAFVVGALLREGAAEVRARRVEGDLRRTLPAVAELVWLGVASGRPADEALRRAAASIPGVLADDLAEVVQATADGVPLPRALDALARDADDPGVAEFSSGMSVALERGTPLADVLRSQATRAREARARDLIGRGRRQVPAVLLTAAAVNAAVLVGLLVWAGRIDLTPPF